MSNPKPSVHIMYLISHVCAWMDLVTDNLFIGPSRDGAPSLYVLILHINIDGTAVLDPVTNFYWLGWSHQQSMFEKDVHGWAVRNISTLWVTACGQALMTKEINQCHCTRSSSNVSTENTLFCERIGRNQYNSLFLKSPFGITVINFIMQSDNEGWMTLKMLLVSRPYTTRPELHLISIWKQILSSHSWYLTLIKSAAVHSFPPPWTGPGKGTEKKKKLAV